MCFIGLRKKICKKSHLYRIIYNILVSPITTVCGITSDGACTAVLLECYLYFTTCYVSVNYDKISVGLQCV